MRNWKLLGIAALLSVAFIAGACQDSSAKDADGDKKPVKEEGDAKPMPAMAVATVENAKAHKDKISGTVTFTEAKEGLRVVAHINGLTPGKHGFHIHEKGDLSDPELKSAGGHFNPGGHKHGGPETEMRHAGDLGNLDADEKGHAMLDKVFPGISLKKDAADNVIGKSVIIHAGPDDLKTDPAGNAGARVAGGVIEAKAAPAKPGNGVKTGNGEATNGKAEK